MSRLTKGLAILSLVVVIALAAMFVWPTRYSYDRTDGERIRIDRFRGYTDILTIYGWQQVTPRPLPSSALRGIELGVSRWPTAAYDIFDSWREQKREGRRYHHLSLLQRATIRSLTGILKDSGWDEAELDFMGVREELRTEYWTDFWDKIYGLDLLEVGYIELTVLDDGGWNLQELTVDVTLDERQGPERITVTLSILDKVKYVRLSAEYVLAESALPTVSVIGAKGTKNLTR